MNNQDRSAYPASAAYHNIEEIGFSKREYIATRAMQAIISTFQTHSPTGKVDSIWVAEMSVQYADDLLLALSKTK